MKKIELMHIRQSVKSANWETTLVEKRLRKQKNCCFFCFQNFDSKKTLPYSNKQTLLE